MKPISLTKLSPYAILAAVFGLSLALFLLVILFQPQLHVTLKAPSYPVFHNIIEFFSVMFSLSISSVYLPFPLLYTGTTSQKLGVAVIAKLLAA